MNEKEIKNHIDGNSLEFKHFKLYADSTLKNMTKDELISYIHAIYHNWKCADIEKERFYKIICDLTNNQPYKLEDLKPNMFVFDKDFNGWGEILRIVETCVNKYGEKLVKCLATGDSSSQTRSYKENRFFPLTKELWR